MRISIAFTTLVAALSVLALPLAKRDSELSLSLRSDVPSSEALLQVRALRKSNIAFSPGALRRLDLMGLHGKDRRRVKMYHKKIMKKEMKNIIGAAKGIIVATAHEGGTVKDEKNHITAQFFDRKGRPIPSKWVKKTDGDKPMETERHHVYADKEKAPLAWKKAVAAGEAAAEARKAAAEALKKKALEDKAAANKRLGQSKPADDLRAEREARQEARKISDWHGFSAGFDLIHL